MTTCKDCVAKLFGACHEEYCEMEQVGLREEAQRRAVARGHALLPFSRVDQRPLWHAQCERCGLEVFFTLDPDPNQLAIFGALLDADCTANGAEDPD